MPDSATPAKAYLGLGSNLGDRLAAMRAAIHALDQHSGVDVDFDRGVSSLYETSPVGGAPGQDPYLNSCIRVETTMSAKNFLEASEAIEAALGRARQQRWGPRVIDIDLLLFGDLVVDDECLSVPHPRLHQRRFVLEPLAEIAGEVLHPLLQVTIADLAARCRVEPTGTVALFAPAGEWL